MEWWTAWAFPGYFSFVALSFFPAPYPSPSCSPTPLRRSFQKGFKFLTTSSNRSWSLPPRPRPSRAFLPPRSAFPRRTLDPKERETMTRTFLPPRSVFPRRTLNPKERKITTRTFLPPRSVFPRLTLDPKEREIFSFTGIRTCTSGIWTFASKIRTDHSGIRTYAAKSAIARSNRYTTRTISIFCNYGSIYSQHSGTVHYPLCLLCPLAIILP